MSVIRLASVSEYNSVKEFYYAMVDAMQDALYTPGWKKGIYPSDDYIRTSIARRELFIMVEDEKILSSMIVNHDSNEGYVKAKWSVDVKPEEITLIHALGVDFDFSRRGIAKKMVAKVISLAKEQGQKVIRLDVLEGNIPAEQLYVHIGFKYIDTVRMYYEDTGWTDYKLYEYVL